MNYFSSLHTIVAYRWQVKLCDLLVTHGPYLSALEIRSLYIKRYINLAVYSTYFTASAVTAVTCLGPVDTLTSRRLPASLC